MTTGTVTLATIPVILNGETVFFRALYLVDEETVLIPLEAIYHVSQVEQWPADSTPILEWNLRRRRVEHSMVVHGDGGYDIEPWPAGCPWTGIANEEETCLRAVHLLKAHVTKNLVAEA